MRPLIGQLDYLNTRPFEPLPGTRIIRAMPSGIGRLARNREIHAGLLSVGDLLRVERDYAPLGGGRPAFGIACRRRAGSVFLLSRVPVPELSGRTIGVTRQTSTAVLLLRVWLRVHIGVVAPKYVRGISRSQDAALLIGDDALREREHPDPEFPFRTDLAAAWREWMGLPFVFAVWSARRSLTPALHDRLTRTLSDALDSGLAGIPEIAREHAGPLGDASAIRAYLSDFTYRFEDEERRGLEAFRDLVREHLPEATTLLEPTPSGAGNER